MSVKKAVIPVAGFATRFLPACKSVPKCMLTIVDKPIIQYLVDEAVASGIEEILLVVGRKKEVVEDYFSEDKELEDFLKERGKESFIPQISNLSGKAKIHFIASIIGVEKVDWKDVPKYGNVSGELISDRLYKVEKMQEKPKVEETKSNLAISDRHVLMPDLFDFLEKTKPGKGGEIQVTDAYNSMVNTKEGVYAYDYKATRFDSGDKLGFVKASVDETLRRPELRDSMIEFLKSLNI